MYRSLALAALAAGSLAAGAANASTGAKPHHRTAHRHVAAAGRYPKLRHLNDLPDDVFAASSRPVGGAAYEPVAFSEARPRLTMERPLGLGAVGSVGLERAGGAVTPRDINGVTLSLPPPPASLVGAAVSYRF